MMRHSVPSPVLGPVSLVLGLVVLPGCPDQPRPGPDAAPANPTTLWLSPIGSDETRVQLVDKAPPPF
jgi:hypothetical protein